MDAQERYQAWLEDPNVDQESKEELRSLANQEEEIYDRFYQYLQFGTGGLRGKLGAGANRMNIYIIRLATQALANVLKSQGKGDKGVVIAYDSRRMSTEFCGEASAVLVANNIPVYAFSRVTPTPILSFAVRHWQAASGIVITASHNPPEYNGYKVYQERGVQLLPEVAGEISEQMKQLTLSDVLVAKDLEENPLFKSISDETYQAYYQAVKEVAVKDGSQDLSISLLYTPLHGTGGEFVPRVLKDAGFTRVATVSEQMEPDGEFPTVKSPNPEEAGCFRLAFAQAGDGDTELILATDPDGDRVGIAVHTPERYVLLTGNQVGILLSDYLLSAVPEEQREQSVIIKTIVSTEMILPIAQKYGVEVINTLTGFKYIGNKIGELEKEGKNFVFGFEESYGYLAGNYAGDKDAVLTSLLISQMAASYKKQGITLVDRLLQLMNEHGYYLESLRGYSFETSSQAERARELIARLRKDSVPEIAGERITIVRDFDSSIERNLTTNSESAIHLPKEDVIQWVTDKGTKITLRPSGTEPKMKLYLGVVGKDQQQAEQRLEAVEAAFDALIQAGLGK